jgi:hypothetical protein
LGLLRVQCAGSTAQALMTLKFQLWSPPAGNSSDVLNET